MELLPGEVARWKLGCAPTRRSFSERGGRLRGFEEEVCCDGVEGKLASAPGAEARTVQ